MTPFITNTQFLDRIDGRWVAQNIMDDGSVPTIAQLVNTSTASGARLETLLGDASETLMAAAAVGARYSENDLRVYGGNLVLQITTGLGIGPILKRRVRAVSDESALNTAYNEALEYVEQLRRGERIFFNVPNVPQAGLPGHPSMEPQPPEPPYLTEDAARYFGCPAAGPGYRGGNPYYPNYPPYTS